MRQGLQERRQRLDDLRDQVFDPDLTDERRDTRVLVYLTVRARLPWLAVAWHDVRRTFVGPHYGTRERPEHEVWRYHLERMNLSDAHRRPSCRLVRP